MTANRASGPEIDRQLPVGERNLSRSRRPFRPRCGGRQPGAGARGLRADARSRCSTIPTARRPEPATSPRCSAAAISRCCSRPPTRRSAASSMLALAGHAGVHLAAFLGRRRRRPASASDRRGLRHAAAGAVPASGRHRDRAGRRRLHGGAARARRDGGRPHPDAGASHRGYGVAAALADASQRRAGSDRSWWSPAPTSRKRRPASRASPAGTAKPTEHRPGASRSTAARCSCCQRGGVRGDVSGNRGAAACRSSAPMRCGCDRSPRSRPCCNRRRMAMRQLGAALVVPFPEELGVGAWLFVENAADLPWRS